MTPLCRACKRRPRRDGQYLCPDCWSSLPAPARRALSRRDSRALPRLLELHKQLEKGVPLNEVGVTP